MDVNDPPELFTGANSTVDTMVMYTEGQPLPLPLAPELEIRGGYAYPEMEGRGNVLLSTHEILKHIKVFLLRRMQKNFDLVS